MAEGSVGQGMAAAIPQDLLGMHTQLWTELFLDAIKPH